MASSGNRKKKKVFYQSKAERRAKTARRAAIYLMRTVIMVVMACIICVVAFLAAVRISNVYILASEGMSLRAECILADGSRNDLDGYFTPSWLERDPELNEKTYSNYTITDYSYNLSVERISVMPWSVVATIIATETVSIRGNVNEELLSEGQNAADFPPPDWTPVRYKIHIISRSGQWYINELETLEKNPIQKPLGTPDPNGTPIPAATATSVPTPTPVPTATPFAGQPFMVLD